MSDTFIQADPEQVKELLRFPEKFFDFLIAQLNAMENKSDVEKKLMQELLDFIKGGGVVDANVIKKEYAERIKDGLIANNIPFHIFNTSSNEVTVWVKDSDRDKYLAIQDAVMKTSVDYAGFATPQAMLHEYTAENRPNIHTLTVNDPADMEFLKTKLFHNGASFGSVYNTIILSPDTMLFNENGKDFERFRLEAALHATKKEIESKTFTDEEKLAYTDFRKLQGEYDNACVKNFVTRAMNGENVIMAPQNNLQSAYLEAKDGKITFHRWEKGEYQDEEIHYNPEKTDVENKAALEAIVSQYGDEIYSEVLYDADKISGMIGISEKELSNNKALEEAKNRAILPLDGISDNLSQHIEAGKFRPKTPENLCEMEQISQDAKEILFDMNNYATKTVTMGPNYANLSNTNKAELKNDAIHTKWNNAEKKSTYTLENGKEITLTPKLKKTIGQATEYYGCYDKTHTPPLRSNSLFVENQKDNQKELIDRVEEVNISKEKSDIDKDVETALNKIIEKKKEIERIQKIGAGRANGLNSIESIKKDTGDIMMSLPTNAGKAVRMAIGSREGLARFGQPGNEGKAFRATVLAKALQSVESESEKAALTDAFEKIESKYTIMELSNDLPERLKQAKAELKEAQKDLCEAGDSIKDKSQLLKDELRDAHRELGTKERIEKEENIERNNTSYDGDERDTSFEASEQ